MSKLDVFYLKACRDELHIEGKALLKSYRKQYSNKNVPYYIGIISNIADVAFVCWKGSQAYIDFETGNVTNNAVYNVKITKKSGNNIVLESLKYEGGDTNEYFEVYISIDNLNNHFKSAISYMQLSQKAMTVLKEVFQLYDKMLDTNNSKHTICKRVARAQASNSYNGHGAYPGGLLQHLVNGLWIAGMLRNIYTFLGENQDLTDLFGLSVLFHDIGKAIGNDYTSHAVTGAVYISEYKQLITSLYSNEFYNQLISIIAQHHSEQNDTDKPQLLVGRLLKSVDCMEAMFSGINSSFIKEEYDDLPSKQKVLVVNGHKYYTL